MSVDGIRWLSTSLKAKVRHLDFQSQSYVSAIASSRKRLTFQRRQTKCWCQRTLARLTRKIWLRWCLEGICTYG